AEDGIRDRTVTGVQTCALPIYQMAAFCMAVYFRGLSPAETFALTDAMIRSGETIDLGAALGRKVVDKHSTGGVGDKTSLAVGPIDRKSVVEGKSRDARGGETTK